MEYKSHDIMASSQYRLAAGLMEMIHEDFQGFHPGYRGIHAQVVDQTLELQKQPPSYLFEELEARLRKAPVVQNLVLQLAKDGDPTDDPTS